MDQRWSFHWDVNDDLKNDIIELYQSNQNKPCVLKRICRNIKKEGLCFDEDFVWKTMLTCLVTTQQRSDKVSNVLKFLKSDSDLFKKDFCKKKYDEHTLNETALKILKDANLWRVNVIAGEIVCNFSKLDADYWSICELLKGECPDSKETELFLVDKMMEFKGLGPKQARNFLQIIGLTQYEIPIDSRVLKWLENKGFPIKLNRSVLANKDMYQFISDAFQFLCQRANIIPCVLESIIFYEKESTINTIEDCYF